MPKYIFLRTLLFRATILCCLCLGTPLFAQAEEWQPGFRTIGVWEPDQGLRLDVAIWYPAKRLPIRVEYGSTIFRVARNAAPAQGLFPLILFMHGSAETRFTWNALAGDLARNGFIVVAPTFTGDNAYDMNYIMSAKQLTNKGREMRLFVEWLGQYPELAKSIDMSRIGVFGAGSGADAALLLAGGRLDANGWENYCQDAKRVRVELGLEAIIDPYCQPWPMQAMGKFAASIALFSAASLPIFDIEKTPFFDAGNVVDFDIASLLTFDIASLLTFDTASLLTFDTTNLPFASTKSIHDTLNIQALALAFPVYGMFVSPPGLQDISSQVLMLTQSQDKIFLPELHTEIVRKALPKKPDVYALVKDDYPLFQGEHTRFFSKLSGPRRTKEINQVSVSSYPVIQRIVDFFVQAM